MSRSYKKFPYCGEDSFKKIGKRAANRRVRCAYRQAIKNKNYEYTLADGSAYKKVYESWDIVDFYSSRTWEEYWQDCQSHYTHWTALGFKEEIPDKAKEYKKWYKWYKSK